MKTQVKTKKLNRPLFAVLLAASVLALPPAPAMAQQTGCNSALMEVDDYSTRNNVLSLDTDNPDYRGCCLAVRLTDASREVVRICEAEGVDNAELRQLKSNLAGLPSSLPTSRCNALPGGSASCREYPALSFAPATQPPTTQPPIVRPPTTFPTTPYIPPITVPDINVDPLGDVGNALDDIIESPVFIGVAAGSLILLVAITSSDDSPSTSPAFVAHPLLSFENDNGARLLRYGTRVEYRRPDSPLALHWSAEGLRTDGADSATAALGGEWRGEAWNFGGELTSRDSRAALALRAGAAMTRAGWRLRLDAHSAAWGSAAWDGPTADLRLEMEKAF